MKHPVPLKLLVLALAASAAGTLAAAAEERPRLEDYPSSYAFLQALEAWNRSHPDGAPPAAVAQAPAATAQPAAPVDPTSEQAPPPFEITGPENLDHAVEQARGLDHPAYKEKLRYHRTTHISFPLNKIDGQDLSQASVGDALNLQGKSAAEKKKALELLTSQLDQDQRHLQDRAESAVSGPEPAVTQSVPPTAVGLHSPGGPQGYSNLTVMGH